MLDFRINTFLTVCQTMNFTKASDVLHITQPAVSQHIHFLEKEYNTKLFHYRNKKLILTDAGEILKKRFLTMTIGEYAIINPLATYLHHHPDTNIHLHYGNTDQLLRMLDCGEINVALVEGNYSKTKYEHAKFSTQDYIAVCAASHQFQGDRPKTLSNLINERLLIRETGSGTRNILEEIHLEDFKMQHDFDMLWEKGSIYSEKYTTICKEFVND